MTTAQDANIPPAPEGRRRLPIGIQTFRKLREGGYYYVDKTGLLGRLVDGGTHYFLSRPRRFGKSLLVDTLKELFEGNRPLFEGLAIHDRWDWTARHPVVRLDFGAGDFDDPEHLPQAVLAQLDAAGEDMGVATRYDIPSLRFQDLLKALHVRTGRRVVVLVDEYDKPILDTLERHCPAWTGTRSATGTTATVGRAPRRSTTLSTSCCCSTGANSGRTGSRPVRRRSCWTRWCRAASRRSL